jgi:dTDP-4-amino-4,6-dideoxygalactose transaminase
MIEFENLAKSNFKFIEKFKKAFEDILESGWFILGKNVESFENKFANYLGIKHCIGVNSGLDALTLSLKCLNLEKGSEVIVPSNTFIATIIAVLNNDLIPVLAEPDIKTYNISPVEVEKNITSKTKAIIVVHLYGKPCEMTQIMEIAKHHDLKVIEDCAQSHGANLNGIKTGKFGDLGAFSHYPTKNLGALGDGGTIVTNNSAFNDTLRILRNYGSNKKYYNDLIGVNSRLDEIQAAFLSIKLEYLDEINSHKRKLADIYFKELNDKFILPDRKKGYYDVFHHFIIRSNERDRLKEFLYNNHIMTEIHYPVPPHKQNILKNLFIEKKFPISEELHNTVLSLPISFFHTEEDIYRVVETLNKFNL